MIFTVLESPKGYPTSQGYVGFITKNSWLLFPTEEEYVEYLKELKESHLRVKELA